jgi:hypothetical protein
VSVFSPALISIRIGKSAAFVLPIVATVCFGAEGRAQTADVYFHPAPLSASRSSFISPEPPLPLDNYAAEGRLRTSPIPPKLDFTNSQPWKDYPLRNKDADDTLGRVPLNGGSFGLEAEQKVDLKKIAPSSEYLDGNIEKHAKKPFVGFSITAPYSSE